MASNLYHILHFLPATEAWEMPPALEMLAQRLVASGKLRINADTTRNFVRHGEMTFTTRELTDPALAQATQHRLARHVAPAAGGQGVTQLWQHLGAEMKKARGVSLEKEIRVARVLAQSAHPAVIQLLIETGTEVFVSYSHNVADLMAVHEWETHGKNSGLQATPSSASAAVYVSAGGDPFFEGSTKTYATDGFPALARMVVIAGQELGHFADLRRSPRGILGRHSTDPHASQLRANPIARDARLADQRNVAALATTYRRCGLAALRRAERGVAFYHHRRRYSPPCLFYQIWRLGAWLRFIILCSQQRLCFQFRLLPYHRLGNAVDLYLADMAFNLSPDAEVYRHPDPLVEEAIAVIEAVARVPQQVNKWGHLAVKHAWPMLYPLYYDTVIKSCTANLKNNNSMTITNTKQNFITKIRRKLRPTPDYYP